MVHFFTNRKGKVFLICLLTFAFCQWTSHFDCFLHQTHHTGQYTGDALVFTCCINTIYSFEVCIFDKLKQRLMEAVSWCYVILNQMWFGLAGRSPDLQFFGNFFKPSPNYDKKLIRWSRGRWLFKVIMNGTGSFAAILLWNKQTYQNKKQTYSCL